jgi:6-phosphogluconolactonase
MTPRVVISDIAQLQQALAKEFEAQAAEVIARRGKCIVALSGGSIARAFFPTLAALRVEWARMEFFWVDERAVPPDHHESNYALASRLLLLPARVPAERIHRMPGELPDLDQAARRASDELKSVAGDPPHLDLAILGVGPDGHIASIFPGLPAEARSAKADGTGRQPCSAPVIAIYDSPKPPARRLTLTMSILASAGLVIVAALGESKAGVMRAALHESDTATPVAELLRRAPSSLVMLDRPAAGLS